jgi:hypothetical protein
LIYFGVMVRAFFLITPQTVARGKRHTALVFLACILVASASAAGDAACTTGSSGAVQWLPGAARVVSRVKSGSRDTPAFEYAYGRRAQCIGFPHDARGINLLDLRALMQHDPTSFFPRIRMPE